MIMHRGGDIRHLCLVPNLRGESIQHFISKYNVVSYKVDFVVFVFFL